MNSDYVSVVVRLSMSVDWITGSLFMKQFLEFRLPAPFACLLVESPNTLVVFTTFRKASFQRLFSCSLILAPLKLFVSYGEDSKPAFKEFSEVF